ncbi:MULTISPECIES: Panacea domain-containing protein [unclassified Spiroplasma]|uniref:Panacea domain-containing protein n=1 Tax=unclassified Spiroplasma TaxID=2637901 RepID=UPI00313A8ED2
MENNNVMDMAKYLIHKNPALFNSKQLFKKNGLKMYKGEFMLHKLLHLAQVFHLLIKNKPLFSVNEEVAYNNGPVIISIRKQHNKPLIFNTKSEINLSKEIKSFIDNIYLFFEDANPDELFEITHYDQCWKEAFQKSEKNIDDGKMDVRNYIDFYKKEYKIAIDHFSELYL